MGGMVGHSGGIGGILTCDAGGNDDMRQGHAGADHLGISRFAGADFLIGEAGGFAAIPNKRAAYFRNSRLVHFLAVSLVGFAG
jgi:hypothetical protein